MNLSIVLTPVIHIFILLFIRLIHETKLTTARTGLELPLCFSMGSDHHDGNCRENFISVKWGIKQQRKINADTLF